ncbi:hypothetical protein F7725_006768 [Dissostichus mawsoni]|uniref:DEUBAD domain-containing protein n=1 Tax=Dissostichus mawsoni TaxID=36200 RepID=A0A7J5XUT9_DISMA|nr:hypothetical protein F7725_006768 [Dissostichus mawsoni]
MDALTHMLTDPLDPKEEDNGQITEECMLGNCRLNLPEDLLEDSDIFFSVLSESTWSEVLSDSQRQHLRQFLPKFPDNNVAEQDETIGDLFNNTNFHFGNPLHLAQKQFRVQTIVCQVPEETTVHSLQQYYHKLLKHILVSRKELLEFAVQNGLDFPPKRKLQTKTHAEMREPRVRRRLSRILKEVKTECGDSNASSDDDDISLWTPAPHSPSSPTPTVSLRVLPSLSTQDMKITEKIELGERDLKAMLQNHRDKRKRQPNKYRRKGHCVTLFDLSLPKKKIKDERRKKKMRTIKVESEDPSEILSPSENASAPPASIINSLPDTPSTPLANIKEEIVEECQSSPAPVEEIAISFFSLLESILATESLTSTSLPAPSTSGSHLSRADGMMALPSGFSPFVEFADESQQWRWIGPTHDTEKDLSALCQLWLDSKDLVIKTENEEMLEMTSPTARVSTDYVVRPSTGDERQVFQIQEQQRYNQPHKAFTFRMHGFESVVGPVNTVVSGALDRLHYEKDPCVKYDIGRKLWIYLHRSRSQEEFERIHQAQAAAAKARKALQQKPKPPSKPLGTILPSSQACPQVSHTVTSQHAARIVSHLAAGSLPQVRVVSAHSGLGPSAGGQQATMLHHTPHQIRMPMSMTAKGISQTVVSLPLRTQSVSSPVHVPTTLSVSAVALAKPQARSPGSPAHNHPLPLLCCMESRPEYKTDSKGQTVLRITPDMMATLAKSPVATVKLTPDFLGSASGSKGISATLHMTPPHSSPSSASGSTSDLQTTKAGSVTSTLLKATGDIRLMPTLAVTMADQKTRTFSTVSSPDKSGATIRIMPGLETGSPITMTTTTGSKTLTASTCANVVTMAASVVAGAKGLTVAPGVSCSTLTLGTATATVRQVPATVVTTQTGKLPTRITVPISVLSQPLKSKSVVTTPMVKGSLNASLSSLGRNIILTTMPAGTKLIAGNKPVRIQTVQAQQLQQRMATGSPKSLSTVVVTTAPSPKCAPDPPPAPKQ